MLTTTVTQVAEKCGHIVTTKSQQQRFVSRMSSFGIELGSLNDALMNTTHTHAHTHTPTHLHTHKGSVLFQIKKREITNLISVYKRC